MSRLSHTHPDNWEDIESSLFDHSDDERTPAMTLVTEFTGKDAKKHSNRWDADDKDARLSTIYIRKGERSDLLDTARKIRVTIEVIE